MKTTLLIRVNEPQNATLSDARSMPTMGHDTSRYELLRMKLLRETEQYLNNPEAEAWERLGSKRPNRMDLELPKLTAA